MNFPVFILALFALWFFVLRTQKSPLTSASEFEARIHTGRPIIVEFFTNT